MQTETCVPDAHPRDASTSAHFASCARTMGCPNLFSNEKGPSYTTRFLDVQLSAPPRTMCQTATPHFIERSQCTCVSFRSTLCFIL